MVSLKSTSPAVRKAGNRGISGLLPGAGRAGYSLSMNADAILGYSFMERHGSEATFALRDASGGALFRLMGHMSEGRPGTREDSSLRAAAGAPALPP